MSDFSRRTIVRGTAWSVPVIAIAAHAPAFAASYPPVKLTYIKAVKCPGQSEETDPWTYIFTFTADSAPAPGSVSASQVDVKGTILAVERVVVEGTTIYVKTVPSTRSPNGNGKLFITYTSGMPPVTQTVEFSYTGTHPDHQLCERI